MKAKNCRKVYAFSILADRRGFTLLELTISIVILALIVLIVAGTLRLGFRSVESGEKRIEYLERIRSSFNFIDEQIQSFAPLKYVDEEDSIKKYYFKGDRNSMQFSSNYSIWGGEKGYVIVNYSVIQGDRKQILSVSENVVGIDARRETRLFDNFDTIYFEYFYKEPTEEEGKWVDTWTDQIHHPYKVKLHLIEGTKDLSLIIPVRAGTAVSGTTSSVPFEEEE